MRTTARRNREGRLVGYSQRTENRQDGHHYLYCFDWDHPQGPRRGTVTDTYDDGCDGDLEQVQTSRFSETGQIMDKHTVDGSDSSWRRYTYDANDNLIRRESDYNVESNEYAESGLGAVFPEERY